MAGFLLSRNFFCIALIVALALGQEMPSFAQGPDIPDTPLIVFSTPINQNTANFQFYQELYSEAFGRLGYEFTLVFHPVKRSLASADEGVTDGEAGRIEQILQTGNYSNLVLVPEAVGWMDIAVYSRDGQAAFSTWDDVDTYRDSDATFAHTRGFVAVETQLPNRVDPSSIFTTSSAAQGCRMLETGRVRFLIEPKVIIDILFRG